MNSDPRKFYINDQQVTDVRSFDEEAGEITFQERHWSTGELIYESDGSHRLATSRGKVRIEGTLPPVSSVIPGERHIPSYPEYDYCGDLPCPMCGQIGCPPSGCDSFCCLQETISIAARASLNRFRGIYLADLWEHLDSPLRMDASGRYICVCPDCAIEHKKERIES